MAEAILFRARGLQPSHGGKPLSSRAAALRAAGASWQLGLKPCTRSYQAVIPSEARHHVHTNPSSRAEVSHGTILSAGWPEPQSRDTARWNLVWRKRQVIGLAVTVPACRPGRKRDALGSFRLFGAFHSQRREGHISRLRFGMAGEERSVAAHLRSR